MFQSQARPPLPCHGQTLSLFEFLCSSFNLRRDHRSLATAALSRHAGQDGRFQSQARPPLPCHAREKSRIARIGRSFNLRRDHRSLATGIPTVIEECKVVFQSQARPPLPCHQEERRLVCKLRQLFQSQARPPLPCHYTLPNPPVSKLCFNLRRDHRSLATHAQMYMHFTSSCFNLRRDHRSLATWESPHLGGDCHRVSISGETTAPLPPALG